MESFELKNKRIAASTNIVNAVAKKTFKCPSHVTQEWVFADNSNNLVVIVER